MSLCCYPGKGRASRELSLGSAGALRSRRDSTAAWVQGDTGVSQVMIISAGGVPTRHNNARTQAAVEEEIIAVGRHD